MLLKLRDDFCINSPLPLGFSIKPDRGLGKAKAGRKKGIAHVTREDHTEQCRQPLRRNRHEQDSSGQVSSNLKLNDNTKRKMRLWEYRGGEKMSSDTKASNAQLEVAGALFFLFHFLLSFYLPSNMPIREVKNSMEKWKKQ